MLRRIHAIAGTAGFLIILSFWTSTVTSELFGSHAVVAQVKTAILWGMIALIPSLAAAGATGFRLGRRRKDRRTLRKRRRMPFIALNGLVVLVPSAVFLAGRANAGLFDAWFYTVQGVELGAGAVNLALMGLNIRDGLTMTGRIGRRTRLGHGDVGRA